MGSIALAALLQRWEYARNTHLDSHGALKLENDAVAMSLSNACRANWLSGEGPEQSYKSAYIQLTKLQGGNEPGAWEGIEC